MFPTIEVELVDSQTVNNRLQRNWKNYSFLVGWMRLLHIFFVISIVSLLFFDIFGVSEASKTKGGQDDARDEATCSSPSCAKPSLPTVIWHGVWLCLTHDFSCPMSYMFLFTRHFIAILSLRTCGVFPLKLELAERRKDLNAVLFISPLDFLYIDLNLRWATHVAIHV